MKLNENTWLKGFYHSGVLAGVAVIIWMQAHFVTKSESKMQWTAHDDLRDNFLIELRSSVRDAKDSIQRIELKLDSIIKSTKTSATNSLNKTRG